MVSVSTEDFPYTLGYLTEFLHVDEAELMAYVQALSLTPKQDEQTGSLVFSHRELEVLRKAIEMKRTGESLATIVERLGQKKQEPSDGYTTEYATKYTQPTYASRGSNLAQAGSANVPNVKSNKDNLSVIVEAVSQAKEGILKDLSRLLDDKLAGLDEVVVELIRCKSENDMLKQKLKAAIQDKEAQEYELSRFKPVQFGFYRKV
jgi:DNA-binding transcriptional MerR regulator